MPCVFRPLTKPGPAEMPTMAMKMLRPTEFMNQMVGVGMRPKLGRTERSHPPMMPAMSAPPAVDSVSGTPAMLKTSEPIRAPITTNSADERHVGDVGRTIGDTQQLDGLVGVLRPAGDRQQVAALNRGVRQDRDHGRGGAAHDLPQEDASRLRHLRQVHQRLAVDRLVAHQDVDALDRHRQQLLILDLVRVCAEHRSPARRGRQRRQRCRPPGERCPRSPLRSSPLRRTRSTKMRASGTQRLGLAHAQARPPCRPPRRDRRALPSAARPCRGRPVP